MLVVALSLAGCGRIGFDATGVAGDADPPLPDAMVFTAPCEQPRRVGTADAITELNIAAEGTLYRATWIDSMRKMHVFGIERTGDAIAVQERIFGGSAFLPTPMGSDVEIAGGRTVSITWGTTQTEVRQLIGAQLGTGRSSAYGALITDLSRFGSQMAMLLTGGDLRVQTAEPAMLTYGPSQVVDMQMTSLQRVVQTVDSAMIVTARPNADDCNVWTYSSALQQSGFSPVPSDTNACNEIVGTYAATGNKRAIAYTYVAGVDESIRFSLVTETADVVAPVTVGAGSEPRAASGGSRFRIAFRDAAGVVRLATLSNDAVVTGSNPLHEAPVIRHALASNTDEVLAMWITATNELWFERLCGP